MPFRPSNVREHLAAGALVSAFASAALLGACAGPSGAPFIGPQEPAEQVPVLVLGDLGELLHLVVVAHVGRDELSDHENDRR